MLGVGLADYAATWGEAHNTPENRARAVAEANDDLAACDARIAELEAKASRLALSREELRLDHLTKKFDILLPGIAEGAFKKVLVDWNAKRLRCGAAGLYTRDVGGLRRLNDTCEADFADVVERKLVRR